MEAKEANSTALVPGSLSAVAKREGQSLAETFLGVDAVMLVDVSASMEQRDSRDGMSRYQVALAELGKIQRSMPGRLGIVAFSTHPIFCPGGAPPMLAGYTDLAKALNFVKVADVAGMRFIVISDGEPASRSPDPADSALKAARCFKGKIDCVYVGPPGGAGEQFLRQLAANSGGAFARDYQVKELAGIVTLLLENK